METVAQRLNVGQRGAQADDLQSRQGRFRRWFGSSVVHLLFILPLGRWCHSRARRGLVLARVGCDAVVVDVEQLGQHVFEQEAAIGVAEHVAFLHTISHTK